MNEHTMEFYIFEKYVFGHNNVHTRTHTHTTVISITVDSLHKGNAFGKLAKLNNVNKWERYGFDSNMAKSAQQQHTLNEDEKKTRNNKQIYESIFTAISFMVNCKAH